MSVLAPASAVSRRRIPPVPLWWLTLGVSLLMHLIALFAYWPELFPKDKKQGGGLGNTMRVQIAQAPAPAPTQAPPAVAAPQQRENPAQPPPREPPRRPEPQPAPSTPPVPVLVQPAVKPQATQPLPTPTPAPTPVAPSAPAEPDMAQLLEARRRARAGSAAAAPAAAAPSSADLERARRDAIVASNMGTIKAPTMGRTLRRSGGVFSLRRVGVYDGEFEFYGWNPDVERQMTQIIEVRVGNQPNMQLAIVRRMIAIIRAHEKEDFNWQSARFNRVLRLSARIADTAALEDHLLREFFDTGPGPR